MPFFAFPLAFLGLLGVPALAAVYWLRSRHRRVSVSSLMLWLDERESREGGRIFERLPFPPIFFLEAAAIVLLTLAAAGPHVFLSGGARPLVVVLDDSYSMLAGGGNSPRTTAIRALESELNTGRYAPVSYILAGEKPRLLAEETAASMLLKPLEKWTCLSPASDLEAATTFALNLKGTRTRILVLTDHAPSEPPDESKSAIEWRAFGTALSNVAFVNAAWNGTRCLFEIANASPQPRTETLTVTVGDSEAKRQTTNLDLAPHEVKRITLTVPASTSGGNGKETALRAKLGGDSLAIDDEVVLLPPIRKIVRVELRARDETLKQLVQKAVEASDQAEQTVNEPDLIVTDQPESGMNGDAWILTIRSEADAKSYIGPFVVDFSHPLAEGLSLNGVIWGAGSGVGTAPSLGIPVVSAGNTPLLTATERTDGKIDLLLRFRPELSTLQNSPNWPILIWNVLDLRASKLPGLERSVLRLGDEAVLTVDSETKSVEVVSPDGKKTDARILDGKVVHGPEGPGLFEFKSVKSVKPESASRFVAVNALSSEESDLTARASGHWGKWIEADTFRSEYRNLTWVFLLSGLGLLAWHASLTALAPQGNRA